MKITVPRCMSINVRIAERSEWYALRVRPSSADIIFEKLEAAGYSVYNPRHRYTKENRRMRVLAERSNPLLPGYMFIVHPRFGMASDDWTEVNAIDGVTGPLKTPEGPLLIPEAVIEKLSAAEFSSTYDDTPAAKRMRGDTERAKLQERFKPGRSYEILEGPFAAYVGAFEKLTEDDRVKVLVDIFGRFVELEFNPDDLADAPGKPKAA